MDSDEKYKDGKWHMLEGNTHNNTVTWLWRKWTGLEWKYISLSHDYGEEKPDPNKLYSSTPPPSGGELFNETK